MSVVICGSFAYDTIMVFNDQFKNHILPDQVHILNVCFLVPGMRKEYGGCAGNIAYNLNLLGGDALPVGTVGEDFEPYQKWMDKHGVNRTHVKTIEDTFTAQAYITTDLDDNQIIAFHPGAMNEAHQNRVDTIENTQLGIISPDGRQAMIEHAEQFKSAGTPFIFDPGQGLPMFDGNDLNQFISQADYVTVNDYESQMLQDKTGRDFDDIAKELNALIVTKGGEGSQIFTDGQCIEIPPAKISGAVDPTGCGDAYRAGLLYGITNGLSWEVTGRLASLIAAIKIETNGTQNHTFDKELLNARHEQSYGGELSI